MESQGSMRIAQRTCVYVLVRDLYQRKVLFLVVFCYDKGFILLPLDLYSFLEEE